MAGFKVKSFVVREELAGVTACYHSVVAWARRLGLVVTSDGSGQAGVIGERAASGVAVVVIASLNWSPRVRHCLLFCSGR